MVIANPTHIHSGYCFAPATSRFRGTAARCPQGEHPGRGFITDSGVIATKAFVAECYRRFEGHFACLHPKQPQAIATLDGVFSLKRLRAAPT